MALPPNSTRQMCTMAVPSTMNKKRGLLKNPSKTLISSLLSFLALISLNTYMNTKMLKNMVKCLPFSNVQASMPIWLGTPKMSSPKKSTMFRTTNWKTAWQMMFLHIRGVMMYSVLPYGLRLKSSSLGGSVAKARAAMVSIIRLTQSI